jgi:hypothetical protein
MYDMIWKVDPAKKGFSDLPKNVHIHRKHYSYSTYPYLYHRRTTLPGGGVLNDMNDTVFIISKFK